MSTEKAMLEHIAELEARARDAEDSFRSEQYLRHAAEAKVRELEAGRAAFVQVTMKAAAEHAEARVRELEAERDEVKRMAAEALREGIAGAMAAEQKLADANALLRSVYECGAPLPREILRPIAAHLAAPPAAPSRTEAEPRPCKTCKGSRKVLGDCGDSPNIWFEPCPDCQPAAPSRTEAEPVWDAINKRWTKVLPRTARLSACRAELTRRGLK